MRARSASGPTGPGGSNKICVHRRYTIRATIVAGPLIGRLMTLRLLSEQGARRKLPAAAGMVVGVGLLAVR